MEQTELEKGMNGRDALDNEGGEVGALLGSLRRVDAPGDFEFGVCARIAAREEVKPRAGLIPFLKLAAPLGLLLAVIGFVFFYASMPRTDLPTVADSRELPQSPTIGSADRAAEAPPPQETSAPQLAQSTESSKPEEAVSRRRTTGPIWTANNKRRTSRGRSVELPMSGSRDTALGVANVIVPRGFESANSRRSVNGNVRSATEVPVREVLSILGVSAEFADSGWTVRSVADNSLGTRAGLKAGDVIEMIDGNRVSSDTKLKGDSAGKTFGIRRSGKRIDLRIGN